MSRIACLCRKRSLDERSSTLSRTRAFTLIELLVVIVVLGILMAVAVPTFLRQQAKAQDSRTQQYLTTAYKAIRASTPETNNAYPTAASLVSWVQQSEPELTAKSASCLTGVSDPATAPVDAILVDPASGANALTLCARSQSGNVWKLTASATGAPTLADGTLVALTVNGNELTDADRAAAVDGDSRLNDSSTGIWGSTTNLNVSGGAEAGVGTWLPYQAPNSTLSRDTSTSVFGAASFKAVYTGSSSTFGMFQIWTPGTAGIPAATAGQNYTFSGWLKATPGFSGKTIRMLLRFTGGANPQKDAVTTVTLTSGWTRWSVTSTVDFSDRNEIDLFLIQSAAPVTNEGFYADGLQFEQQPIATPYVETNGTTAARGAADVEAPAALLSTTQGWVAMRVRLGWPSSISGGYPTVSPTRLWEWSDFANPAGWMGISIGSTGVWTMTRFNTSGGAGGGAYASAPAASWNAGETLTIVAAWTATQVKISVNGAPFTVTNAAFIPTFSQPRFVIGGAAWNYPSQGDFKWFACGLGTLANADAATINAIGDADPKLVSLPGQPDMVWNGVNAYGSLK